MRMSNKRTISGHSLDLTVADFDDLLEGFSPESKVSIKVQKSDRPGELDWITISVEELDV